MWDLATTLYEPNASSPTIPGTHDPDALRPQGCTQAARPVPGEACCPDHDSRSALTEGRGADPGLGLLRSTPILVFGLLCIQGLLSAPLPTGVPWFVTRKQGCEPEGWGEGSIWGTGPWSCSGLLRSGVSSVAEPAARRSGAHPFLFCQCLWTGVASCGPCCPSRLPALQLLLHVKLFMWKCPACALSPGWTLTNRRAAV